MRQKYTHIGCYQFTLNTVFASMVFTIYWLGLFTLCLSQVAYSQKRQVIDLTWDFDMETVYWDGSRKFEFTKITADYDEGFWMALNEFCAAEHGGTHLDAPYHFNKDGWKVAEIPLERLIVPGSTIDVTDEVVKDGADFRLLPSHLEKWEQENSSFENGSVLIIRYGWSQYWHNRTEYLGLVGDKMNFPGLSKEAAEWIAESGKFYGIGVDTSSGDAGSSEEFWAHRLLADKSMYNLENLKIIDNLPAKNYTLVISPMKIGKGTGGPLRILAVLNKSL